MAWRFLRTRSREFLRALVDMLRRRAEASAASHRQVAVLSHHVAVADAVQGAGVSNLTEGRGVDIWAIDDTPHLRDALRDEALHQRR
ncbi:MAG: hypothetical protein ACLGI8_04880 [Acidimicrobiia bacterium]